MKINKENRGKEKQWRRDALKRMAKIVLVAVGVNAISGTLHSDSQSDNHKENENYEKYSKYGDTIAYSKHYSYAGYYSEYLKL